MPSSGPSVSVVIPCYNSEKFVTDAMESVFAQSYPLMEVVCVDDGSTDETLDLLRRLQSRSDETVVVLSQPNGGPSAARNLGLSRATGDYVQFLDADDILEPNKIDHQIRLVEATDRLPDIVAAAYIAEYVSSGRSEVINVEEDPWVGLFIGRFGITSANLYRRESVLDVGGWNEDMKTSEDPELAFRILRRRQNVVFDTTPNTRVRRRNNSQWNANMQASMRGWLRLRMDMSEWVRERGILDSSQMDIIEQKMFRVIRRVDAYDSALAADAYRTLSHTFSPRREDQGTAYVLIYRTLGFSVAQRLRHDWLRLRAILSRLKGAIHQLLRAPDTDNGAA